MLSFMGEDKRLLNVHKQKFAKLAAFQANTTAFQANTNASLKNLETQASPIYTKSVKYQGLYGHNT